MIIALTGFMGSGKSCVGRELSSLLCLPFIDLDECIVSRTGKSIPEIFASEGELPFRSIEAQVLSEVLASCKSGTSLILSLGGGTVMSDANADLISRKCKCVYLRASADTLRKRLSRGSGDRPLWQNGDIDQLLAKRKSIYERIADIVIDTDELSVPQVVQDIVKQTFR